MTFGATVQDVFKGGPYCLSLLAQLDSFTHHHNFLFMCTIFLKRKYPENWDEALRWVNYSVLRPAGYVNSFGYINKRYRFTRPTKLSLSMQRRTGVWPV